MTIEVFNGDCLMNTSVVTYELTENMTPYRYVLSSQMYDDNMEIKITFHTEAGDGSMENIKVENMKGTFQREHVGLSYYDGGRANSRSRAHEGGVTFDLLDRDLKQ